MRKLRKYPESDQKILKHKTNSIQIKHFISSLWVYLIQT